jgi:hypothetical protein
MAAFDTPLINQLLTLPRQQHYNNQPSCPSSPSPFSITMPSSKPEAKSAILAQFPPNQQPVGTTNPGPPDSTTNLLDTTPPQIVRALAQAGPLIHGFNTLLGLLTWTSGQDWLSFFLVFGWWITCLYGSIIVKFAGNFVPVIVIAIWYTLQKQRTFIHSSTCIIR